MLPEPLDERSALAARLFPAEWGRWSSKTGPVAKKHRQRLRKAAEVDALLKPLRASGARCRTCANYQQIPADRQKRHHCDAESDFHGYVIARPEGLCLLWRAATPKVAA